MKTKCLIVDDEPLAIEVIESHLLKLDSFEIVGKCSNAIEAFDLLKSKQVDLIFLDIQMPGMKGTDFLRTLNTAPAVILTTAFREFALEGYELNVVDYLLKPISFERFFKAISKYVESNVGKISLHKGQNQLAANDFLYVRVNKKVHKLILNQILYIESIKDYLRIYTTTRQLVVKHTISAFEDKIPENQFIRIHRSYIVSLNFITGFTASTIELGKVELPIGRSYKLNVFRVLNYKPLED